MFGQLNHHFWGDPSTMEYIIPTAYITHVVTCIRISILVKDQVFVMCFGVYCVVSFVCVCVSCGNIMCSCILILHADIHLIPSLFMYVTRYITDHAEWQLTGAVNFTAYWLFMGSSVGILTGYGLDSPGIESRWGARFSAPVQIGPGAHPASCTMGAGSFLGVKSGRGVTLTPHPLLVPWSRKGRAIPLLPLWAVRPVQSLSACTRVHFTPYPY
jgi:hypothetical protein